MVDSHETYDNYCEKMTSFDAFCVFISPKVDIRNIHGGGGG